MTRKQIVRKRLATQDRVWSIVNVLHDEGFNSLLIESTQIGLEDYYTRIVIDKTDLGWDEMETLFTICQTHNCKLSLRHDYKEGPRVALWVPLG